MWIKYIKIFLEPIPNQSVQGLCFSSCSFNLELISYSIQYYLSLNIGLQHYSLRLYTVCKINPSFPSKMLWITYYNLQQFLNITFTCFPSQNVHFYNERHSYKVCLCTTSSVMFSVNVQVQKKNQCNIKKTKLHNLFSCVLMLFYIFYIKFVAQYCGISPKDLQLTECRNYVLFVYVTVSDIQKMNKMVITKKKSNLKIGKKLEISYTYKIFGNKL